MEEYTSNLDFVSKVAKIEERTGDYTICGNCNKNGRKCVQTAKDGDCQFYNTHKDEHFSKKYGVDLVDK